MTGGARDRRVTEAISERRDRVNAAIDEEIPVEPPERLYEASRYLLDAGGKRLRPAMLLMAGEAIADVPPGSIDYRSFPDQQGDRVDLMMAAVSVEVVHLFTLIHDDIMDEDDLRRGVPAVHRAYDTETAILAGDTLYSKAFEVMLRTEAPDDRSVRALDVLARTCTEICEGQAMDIGFEERDTVGVDEYLSMIERKTAVLYGAAAALPAVLLGADESVHDALYQYGIDVGRGFQIQDDVLDLVMPSDAIGKRRGSDLVEEKQTLITVHAREAGVDVDGLVDGDADDVTEADIEAAVSTLAESGSIDYARETASEFVESGKAELEVLPDNEARNLLTDVADFLIERDH
ncbi:MAG TPA: polyprenyl synthetase family protein [Halobacteriales archaeon]|nr:polyprenyl synthetase family protein [Halobacteriales archaeon]